MAEDDLLKAIDDLKAPQDFLGAFLDDISFMVPQETGITMTNLALTDGPQYECEPRYMPRYLSLHLPWHQTCAKAPRMAKMGLDL